MQWHGEVDKNDAMIRNYSCIRKTYKWYKKIIFYFLEEALYNGFIVYSKEDEKKFTKFMLFKLEVIHEMLEDAHQIPVSASTKKNHRRDVLPVTKRKFGKNFVINSKTVKIIQDCALDHVSWYTTLRVTLGKTQMICNTLTNKSFFPKQFVKAAINFNFFTNIRMVSGVVKNIFLVETQNGIHVYVTRALVLFWKPLGSFKVDSVFHPSSSVKWLLGISENSMVGSKLPPQSVSSLETVELHPKKWVIRFF